MTTLLAISLLIDTLITFFLFKQAFGQRSNMNRKYKIRFVAMLAVIAASVFLKGSNVQLACLIAGVPAGLVSFFTIGLAIALFTHKGPWR